MNIGWILLTVLMIGILVAVHELGHFTVAKKLHFPVHEYSIGMGPAIFKKQYKGTQYSLRALPLGGYVAFESATDTVEEERTFRKQPLGYRFWVVLAGPLMNILIAFLISAIVLCFWGNGAPIPKIDTVGAETAAEAAGLVPGDEFIAVNGTDIGGSYEAFSAMLAENTGEELVLTVVRDGRTFDVKVTPKYDSENGRYMLGITMAYAYKPMNPLKALWGSVLWIGQLIGDLFAFLGGLFRGKGTGDVAGIVGAVSMVSEAGASYGMPTFLSMIAYLSVNLGIMNLLPLPALDGGKLLLMGVEKITGKQVPPEKEGIINLVALGVFLVLFLLLTFRDVSRIIGG